MYAIYAIYGDSKRKILIFLLVKIEIYFALNINCGYSLEPPEHIFTHSVVDMTDCKNDNSKCKIEMFS